MPGPGNQNKSSRKKADTAQNTAPHPHVEELTPSDAHNLLVFMDQVAPRGIQANQVYAVLIHKLTKIRGNHKPQEAAESGENSTPASQ